MNRSACRLVGLGLRALILGSSVIQGKQGQAQKQASKDELSRCDHELSRGRNIPTSGAMII
jgi:hypothetical protein